jgi:hypothetical protein
MTKTEHVDTTRAGELLTGLRWTSWRPAAFGRGVLKVDDCIPTCAQGRYVRYPVLTALWRARPWPRHPGRGVFQPADHDPHREAPGPHRADSHADPAADLISAWT